MSTENTMARKTNGPKEPNNNKKPAPLSLITIVGEGYDEWKQRYFKLKSGPNYRLSAERWTIFSRRCLLFST
jgi:hypothetical protein